jgi:glycosyltransferase involved in cell wall biosynthesis
VAGYLGAEHKAYLNRIESRMREWGLSDEFHYRGVLDREAKIEFLQNLDVLSVPATYDEPKGMFLLEAMACGVPLVQPRRGAFPEIIEKTGGGILVGPDDAKSLADGLISLYKDPELAARLARQGFDGVRKHYNVARMAARALEVYAGLAAQSAAGRREAVSLKAPVAEPA